MWGFENGLIGAVTTPTIIILAMVAAFLGLRLYSVLGKHGEDGVVRHADDLPPRAQPAPHAVPAPSVSGERANAPAPMVMAYDPIAERGIRDILAADRSFDVGRFLSGAEGAYRLILEAFWSGDKESLAKYCDADSLAAFEAAVDARAERGESLDNRLVHIDSARIVDAELVRDMAHITVAFEADIAAITRDATGQVIAGSMTDAMTTHDRWSFVRSIKSSNPNWLLDETDAT